MTKPTGRPRGRPKTKEYVTLMARVDVTLADQVKHYAALHRQPLSVVIRDALVLLMEEYPAAANRTGPQRLAMHEFLSDRYESPLDMLLEETDSTEREALMSDTNRAVIDTILSDTNKGDDILSDANKGKIIASDTKAVHGDIMSDTNAAPTLPLLPDGQEWREPCTKNPAHVDPQTGWTVRRRQKDKSNPSGYRWVCRGCDLERKRAKRHTTPA
jgi:hypothetical protein